LREDENNTSAIDTCGAGPDTGYMRIVLAMVIVGSLGAALVRLQPPIGDIFQETQPKDRTMSTEQRPFFVRPGEGREGDTFTGRHRILVKVSGADTGGALAALEVRTAVDSGPSLHVHHVENEWFYALEGAYDIQVGAEIFHLTPGGSVYGPKLVPHTWHDVGETPGRMLVVAQPAGHLEAFAKDLESIGPDGMQAPGAEKALFERHNMQIAGPPLPKKFAK
jgi:mannose-6-phosphate isomerase-like protein (cupin superfamily)